MEHLHILRGSFWYAIIHNKVGCVQNKAPYHMVHMSPRWPSSLYYLIGNSDQITIGKTQPTLVNHNQFDWLAMALVVSLKSSWLVSIIQSDLSRSFFHPDSKQTDRLRTIWTRSHQNGPRPGFILRIPQKCFALNSDPVVKSNTSQKDLKSSG